MGRQTFDIKEFKYGVISALDEEDIPPESASDNLNVDGDSAEGILRGIPYDTELLVDTDIDGTADDSIGNIRLGEFIEHDGTYDLIYHDSDANKICAICDFYGTPQKLDITPTGVTVEDSTTILANNKEVHIGLGHTDPAYWVGYVDHPQFDYPQTFTVTNVTNSGGKFLLTIDTTSDVLALSSNDVIKVTGVVGCPANGYWVAETVTSYATATTGTILLKNSTFSGTYTSGGTVTPYLTVEYDECRVLEGTTNGLFTLTTTESASPTDGYFQSGILYAWKYSLIYNGVEESPLSAIVGEGYVTDTASAELDYYTVTIVANNATPTAGNTTGLASFNKRVTGVNLYRADSSDATTANLGLFRLVASVDINDDNWAPSTVDQVCTVIDYGTYYKLGSTAGTLAYGNPVTYNENAGISETLSRNTIFYWKLSTKGNGYQFVGNAWQSLISNDTDRYIFRSKYLRYSMFDWTSDFLVLPEPMTALHFYEGKLWAFSLNKAYRINPDGLYIEDVFDDAGCQGQRAVHSNEYGMFFGNSLNAWMYNGQFYKIGDAIRQSMSGGKSWATFGFSTLTHLIITSDSKKGYVLFINERSDSGNKIFAWAYHPSKKRWDAWSFGGYASDADAGVFKGKEGEVYLSIASNTYKLLRSTNTTYTRAWEWYSQELTFGETRQNKSITMIKVDATGTVTLTYGVDGTTPATSGTSDALINTYAKSLRIKLNANAVATGTAFTNYVDSLEIVYRPLVGAR